MPPTLFDVLTPRPEVLEGTLSDAVFAASLEDVLAGVGPEIYRDPVRFFAATHPSDGLKATLDESLGRATGARPDASPLLRLETNLGGGKTHNLIALLHAARGDLPANLAPEFVDPKVLPSEPIEQVAAFVGTSVGGGAFPDIDGVAAQTIWGYLALQLGGLAAYEKVRTDDEARTAPGANELRAIFGGRPTIIMLDELARYLQVAEGVTVSNSTLAKQVVAFLLALFEAADREPHTVVVITMTELTDPFGGSTEAVHDVISEARSVMARKERVLRPSGEADLPKILARRLFEAVPGASTAAEVGTAYAEAAAAFAQGGVDLNDEVLGAGWATTVADSYPFHPELVRVLDKRVSTIPNFQRTRGALRLLARTVRGLWDTRPDGTLLIQLDNLNLRDPDTAEDLSSRIDRPKWEPVIRADVASSQGGEMSHADEIDARLDTELAGRLATGIYLFSLTEDVPGVPAPELFGAVLRPSDDANIATKALDALEHEAWYLHTDLRGYRFSTEVALPKLILDAQQEISKGKVKAAATDILASQFKDSALKVRRTWEDERVPDRSDDAWLVLLHWDQVQLDGPDPVPEVVSNLWSNAPAGGPREFRNRLVFLAPQKQNHEAMLASVQRHLALKRLVNSADKVAQLSDEKRAELRGLAKQSEAEVRIAVCNHVNLLFFPVGSGLEGQELDLVTQASLKPNQTDAVLDRLSTMEKTLTAGSKPLDPRMIKQKLGKLLEQPLSTADFLDQFARRADLKMVLDRKQIADLIVGGVRAKTWEYQDPELGDQGWGTADRPAASVRIDAQTLLHPVGSAPAPAAVVCPLCGGSHPGQPCPKGPGPDPTPAGATFSGDGAAAHALEAARQAAGEAGRQKLVGLTIDIEATGANTATELARLMTMAPSGAVVRYRLDIRAVLDEPVDVLKVEFDGAAAAYEPVRAALDQVLRKREAVVKATLSATIATPMELAGDEVQQLVDAAKSTGPSKCSVLLETESG